MGDAKHLEQPPWSALTSTHAALALGNALARRYPPDVAPMAGIREVSDACLDALAALMKPDNVVGLFSAEPVPANGDLVVVGHEMIEQMIYDGSEILPATGEHVPLTPADVPEMEEFVELTKPGPFAPRTIALGSYIGMRNGGQLVAMAGERMRFDASRKFPPCARTPITAGAATRFVWSAR